MKVKIKNRVYDSRKEPIMVIMSPKEKQNILLMPDDKTRFCSYPKDMDKKKIEKFMKDE